MTWYNNTAYDSTNVLKAIIHGTNDDIVQNHITLNFYTLSQKGGAILLTHLGLKTSSLAHFQEIERKRSFKDSTKIILQACHCEI